MSDALFYLFAVVIMGLSFVFLKRRVTMTIGARLAIIVLLAALPQAQRATFSFDVLIDPPLSIGRALKTAARAGYTCGNVARPTAPLLSNNVAVIVGRPAGTTRPPATQDIEVVVGRFVPLEDFERDVNALAAKGYRLCGFTITTPVYSKATEFTPVAVMTRPLAGTTDTWAYRLIRTRGRSGEWAVLEKAAAEGFAVSSLVSRPVAPVGDVGDLLFVAEKGPGARALIYDLAFSGNAVALQKEIDKAPRQDFRIQAVWAVNDRVSVLLAKPKDGSWDTPREYKVDDPSQFRLRFSAVDGDLLGLLRFKDGAMGFYDRRQRTQDYSIVEGNVIDPAKRPFGRVDVERRLVDKLNVDGGRGYWPIDFTWRSGSSAGEPAVDVILSRTTAK